MIRIFFLLCFLSMSLNVYSNEKTLKYIEKYSEIAVNEMNKYNIPASITLAQGILESGNGLSKLAVEGKIILVSNVIAHEGDRFIMMTMKK